MSTPVLINTTVASGSYSFEFSAFPHSYMSLQNGTTSPGALVQGQPTQASWIVNSISDTNYVTVQNTNDCLFLSEENGIVVVGANNNTPFHWFIWTLVNSSADYFMIADPNTYLNLDLSSGTAGTNVTLTNENLANYTKSPPLWFYQNSSGNGQCP